VETVEWSLDILVSKIAQLYECIASVDAAVNVFGVDCSDLILNDEDVNSEFIQQALTPEQRAKLRATFEELTGQIREDRNLTPEERVKLLAEILLYNYAKREMAVNGIGVSNERRDVLVDIPDPQKDLSNDEALRDAVIDCGRYAILARSVFGADFDRYAVRRLSEKDQPRLMTVHSGKLLDEYIQERAGLLDLLHEADVRLDGKKIVFSVDFEKLAAAERQSLDRSFPRKNRPGGGS
jgi:hypothetical protein